MSSSRDWTLIKTRDHVGIALAQSEEMTCGEFEAVELLECGQATLAKSPEKPPVHLLALLTERVKDIDCLGLEISDPGTYQRILDKVLRGDVRQTFVDGHSLNWRRGKKELRQAVGRCLSQCSDPNCDLFYFFRLATFEGSNWTPAEFNSMPEKIYGLELARSAPPLVHSLPVLATSVNVPGGSLEFTHKALKLQGEFETVIRIAISKGRIIVAQETLRGDRLIAADIAAAIAPEDMDDGYFFLLSVELPPSVTATNKPLHRKKIDAGAWVERICGHFIERNKRLSQKDVKIVLRSRFGLTENAAKEVIKIANWPKGWSSGRIPDDQKIDINEIRDIN